jgi:choice-of-anchor A domain-containing protein
VYAGARGATSAALDLRQERGMVDFKSETNWLTMLAASLARLPASGSVSATAGSLTLRGSLAAIEVFTVPAAQTARGYGVVLQNVRDGAHVLINVVPDPQRRVALGWNTDAFKGRHTRVLYNLAETDVLRIDDTVVWGSVLAPYAWVLASSGRIEGTVVAASWNSGAAIGYAPFEPPAPSPQEQQMQQAPQSQQ